MNNECYYRPSRQFTLLGSFLMLAGGFVASAILGAVYAYLILYNPFIYVNFLASLGFGFGIGVAAGFGIRIGKVRWPTVAFANGAMIGVVGLYVSWVVWMHAFASRGGVAGLWPLDPADLWLLVQDVAANGAWSMRGSTPTGGFLYAIWGIEAMIIVGLAALTCGAQAREPFCEECEEWTKPIVQIPIGPVDDEAALRGELEANRMEAIAALGPARADARTNLTLQVCPGCDAAGFLTLEGVTVTVDVKKKTKDEKKKPILKDLVLDTAAIETVRGLAASVIAAIAAAPAPEGEPGADPG